MRIIPAYLKRGDKIAIIAPARKISREEIQPAIDIYTSWGLQVVVHDDLFETAHQFAGNDLIRANNFQRALDDKQIKAIICARGGYGTVRIIDQVDFSSLKKAPKWIVGFSDITVLHAHVHTCFNMETIHGEMPINMVAGKADEESLESLRKALFGEKISYLCSSQPLNKMGQVKGTLIGGNLSVLYSLLGSVSDIDTNGKILFLEDLDEYLYHIDRMMMNLKRNNKLDNLAGMVVGGMNGMRDNTIPFGKTAEKIIYDHVKVFSYPICFGFPAGHDRRNLALKFGAEAALNVQSSFTTLSFD